MAGFVLIIHMLLALGIIGFVLLQRSEGGGLGIGAGGGGGGSMGGLVGSRAAANFLTRGTGVLAGLFFATSIVLAILSGTGADRTRSLVTDGIPITSGAPADGGAMQQPHTPAPTGPAVPVGE